MRILHCVLREYLNQTKPKKMEWVAPPCDPVQEEQCWKWVDVFKVLIIFQLIPAQWSTNEHVGPRVQVQGLIPAPAFQCGVCMVSSCLHGFSLGTLVFIQHKSGCWLLKMCFQVFVLRASEIALATPWPSKDTGEKNLARPLMPVSIVICSYKIYCTSTSMLFEAL